MKTGDWIHSDSEKSVCADTEAEAIELWRAENSDVDYVTPWIGVGHVITEAELDNGDLVDETAEVGQTWYDEVAGPGDRELKEGEHRFWLPYHWTPFFRVTPPTWPDNDTGAYRVEVNKQVVGLFDTMEEAEEVRRQTSERLTEEWKAQHPPPPWPCPGCEEHCGTPGCIECDPALIARGESDQ